MAKGFSLEMCPWVYRAQFHEDGSWSGEYVEQPHRTPAEEERLGADERAKLLLQRNKGAFQRLQGIILDDAASGAGRQVKKRRVDNPLQVGGKPGLMVKNINVPDILKYARAGAVQADMRLVVRLAKIYFRIHIAKRRR